MFSGARHSPARPVTPPMRLAPSRCASRRDPRHALAACPTKRQRKEHRFRQRSPSRPVFHAHYQFREALEGRPAGGPRPAADRFADATLSSRDAKQFFMTQRHAAPTSQSNRGSTVRHVARPCAGIPPLGCGRRRSAPGRAVWSARGLSFPLKTLSIGACRGSRRTCNARIQGLHAVFTWSRASRRSPQTTTTTRSHSLRRPFPVESRPLRRRHPSSLDLHSRTES